MSEKLERSFTDAAGDRWTLRVHYGLREPLKAVAEFDFLKVFETRFAALGDVLGNIERLVACLAETLAPQITARGLSPEQFAERFDGPTIEAAAEAFAAAVIDFFPEPQRGIGHAAIAKGTSTIPKMVAATIDAIERIDADRLVAQLSGGSGD